MSRVRTSAWPLVAAAACWGTATAISKRAVDEIAPLTLLPIQLAVSVAMLAVASLIEARGLPSEHRRPLALLGVLDPGLSYALGLAGLARITASGSALLWATEPVLILLIAWAMLRQRPPSRLRHDGGTRNGLRIPDPRRHRETQPGWAREGDWRRVVSSAVVVVVRP